jgi:hypothetical protein
VSGRRSPDHPDAGPEDSLIHPSRWHI